MNYGFVRMAAGTPAIRPADCRFNAQSILGTMREAARRGVSLLALPELCVTGYTCGDLFLQRALLDGAREALDALVEGSRGLDLVAVAGLPLEWGGKLYNCAAVFGGGRLLGVVPKTHLPNYGEFYERRHFAPAPEGVGVVRAAGREVPFGANLLFRCEAMRDFTFAVEICEDLWAPDAPSVRHALAGALVVVNPSAGDELAGKADYRRALVAGQSARLVCGYLYAGAGDGESTTDMVFSGHCLAAENGALLAETPPFQNGLAAAELDLERLAAERRRLTTFGCAENPAYRVVTFPLHLPELTLTRPVARLPFVPGEADGRGRRCEEILALQAAGLKRRLEHTGCRAAVLGVSGGLDSALALLVAARAMDALGRPRRDVLAVTMPCFGTSERTRDNAERLCGALGVELRTVDVTAAVRRHFADIGQDPERRDVTYENAQARERTQVLMDLANRTGGLVVGTGDLSELALGWATYNGDHMSMYAVNASVPKTLVRHLVRHAACKAGEGALRAVLLDILDTPVSPELLPAGEGGAQKTEELVGPYELHDFFLYYLVRCGFTPQKILWLARQAFAGAYGEAAIRRWLAVFCRRFFAQQFKRSCLPDGPKVGSVSLSPRADWRMPSDASAALWLDGLDGA